MGKPDPEAAEGKAEFWLKQNEFSSLPVDPFQIAAQLDISVRAKDDIDRGVSGMLLRHGDDFGILYATHIRSVGYQRFSIAHEIGHYLLEGHAEALFADGQQTHRSRAGFVSQDLLEREADHFASGLLMPDGLFRAALRRCSEGLPGIEELSDRCLTSLTATAIRYAKKTQVPAAIVVSTDGLVDYAFLSRDMRAFEGIVAPRKGDRLPVGSLTEDFARGSANVTEAKRQTADFDLNVWLGGRRGLEATEEVIGLGDFGKVLTVLTTAHLAEEGDEEAGMEDSWTPKFRR